MTHAFPGARLPSAFAASLAIHIALGAALAAAAGWQWGTSDAPGMKRVALLATLRAAKPAQSAPRPNAASPRGRPGTLDTASVGATLPKPYYYPAAQLTERPLALAAIEPRFPSGAPGTGRVKVRLYINDHGSVDAVDITDTEPAGEFEEATVQAFGQARFRPGYKDGTAVRSQLALEVRFGEPTPPAELPLDQVARAVPENPNAWDAPDRIGIKIRRLR